MFFLCFAIERGEWRDLGWAGSVNLMAEELGIPRQLLSDKKADHNLYLRATRKMVSCPLLYYARGKIVLVFGANFSIFKLLRTVRFLSFLLTETELSWAQVVAIISF